MNSLQVDIEKGQKVVMQGTGSEAERTVTVFGGFGMQKSTSGSALFVTLPDGSKTRMDSHEIEKVVN